MYASSPTYHRDHLVDALRRVLPTAAGIEADGADGIVLTGRAGIYTVRVTFDDDVAPTVTTETVLSCPPGFEPDDGMAVDLPRGFHSVTVDHGRRLRVDYRTFAAEISESVDEFERSTPRLSARLLG